MKTLDKILVLEGACIALYTVVDMIVFYKTGSEPSTLTSCFFAFWGLENGVMGWIKTTKDKQPTTTSTSIPDDEMEDKQEPDDVGIN